MSLASVVTITTSHYVAFAKSVASGKWLFFDSMADRQGLAGGFNVPKVDQAPSLSLSLSLASLSPSPGNRGAPTLFLPVPRGPGPAGSAAAGRACGHGAAAG